MMKVREVYSYQGVKVEFSGSMLEQDLYSYWAEKFAAIDRDEMAYFDSFLYVAATITSVKGLDWSRPLRNVDEEGIRQSYYNLLGQVNLEFFMGLQAAVNEVLMPSANEIEKPDTALTDEEKKIQS